IRRRTHMLPKTAFPPAFIAWVGWRSAVKSFMDHPANSAAERQRPCHAHCSRAQKNSSASIQGSGRANAALREIEPKSQHLAQPTLSFLTLASANVSAATYSATALNIGRLSPSSSVAAASNIRLNWCKLDAAEWRNQPLDRTLVIASEVRSVSIVATFRAMAR